MNNKNNLLNDYKDSLALEAKKENETLEKEFQYLLNEYYNRKKALYIETKEIKEQNKILSKRCMALNKNSGSCLECINHNCKNYISFESIYYGENF